MQLLKRATLFLFMFCNTLLSYELDSSPILVLGNGLYPSAAINEQGEIYCSGIYWYPTYPLTAQKVDQDGNSLWPNKPYGILLCYPQEPLDCVRKPPLILPKPDGGAFFAYEYAKFCYWDQNVDVTGNIPYLQSVSPEGEILDGTNGIKLTNLKLFLGGGSNILGINYDDDGNVLVFWHWVTVDTTTLQRTDAIFYQKVDPETHRLLGDSTGIKLYDVSYRQTTCSALYSNCGRYYFLAPPWISCISQNAEIIWSKELFEIYSNQITYRTATNDDGDIFLIYEENKIIKGRLFSAGGEVIWKDIELIRGSRLYWNSPLMPWGNDRWILGQGPKLYCISRDGRNLWDEDGIEILDSTVFKITNILHVNNNLYVLYSNFNEQTETHLKLQKLDQLGQFLWPDSPLVMEGLGFYTPVLLTDSRYIYVVEEGFGLPEPYDRPRGTFLQKIDSDGNTGFITNVLPPLNSSLPDDFPVASNYPNPFGNSTTIEIINYKFRISDICHLRIFNILGKEVKTIQLRANGANSVKINWDGRDQSGMRVAKGIYFYEITNTKGLLIRGKLIRLDN